MIFVLISFKNANEEVIDLVWALGQVYLQVCIDSLLIVTSMQVKKL
jgi:hypothetical protein